MYRYFYLIIFLFFTHYIDATICRSQIDGDWGSAATWDCGAIPGCYDTIVVNHIVTITSSVNLNSCSKVTLIVNDSLVFNSGQKLELPCGSAVYISSTGWLIPLGPTSGSSQSNRIRICGNVVWKSGDGPMGGTTVLDISLLSFTGTLNGSYVDLNWQTASEVNNSHFIIEKSTNGYDFEFLTQVSGAGNSNVTLSYSCKDKSPELGTNYYRLKSVDFNSVTKNEGIAAVNYNKFDFSFYPNPFRDNINISVNGSYEYLTLQVCNIVGEFVSELKLNGGDSHQISKEQLGITSKGSYFLVLYPNSNYHLASKKIINH
jgi:hypothetical protein